METLSRILRPAEAELGRVEAIIRESLSSAEERLRDLEHYSVEVKGKRIRPALALLCGEAAGDLTEDHIIFAAAAELIHMATLAHDDVIDGALLRRGKTTLNASWGNPVAVLFGDYLLSRAFELLCRSAHDGILPAMLRTTREVCEGEIYQLRRRYDIGMTEDEYRLMVSRKTASLFSACCGLGASLAGAPPPIVESLAHFGGRFGAAYQIIDDCCDTSGADGSKDRFKDIEKGLVTLPLIKALSALDGESRERLAVAFRDGEVAACRREILLAGGIDACLKEAEAIMAEAQGNLALIPDSPARESLAALTGIIVEWGKTRAINP
jgi:octaprenyl-diphosphate synthase